MSMLTLNPGATEKRAWQIPNTEGQNEKTQFNFN